MNSLRKISSTKFHKTITTWEEFRRNWSDLHNFLIGGELTDLEHTTFKDLDQVEIVGVFPNYATAHAAWKAKAQQTVDNAHMRYFVVHLHRLLDPGQDTKPAR